MEERTDDKGLSDRRDGIPGSPRCDDPTRKWEYAAHHESKPSACFLAPWHRMGTGTSRIRTRDRRCGPELRCDRAYGNESLTGAAERRCGDTTLARSCASRLCCPCLVHLDCWDRPHPICILSVQTGDRRGDQTERQSLVNTARHTIPQTGRSRHAGSDKAPFYRHCSDRFQGPNGRCTRGCSATL